MDFAMIAYIVFCIFLIAGGGTMFVRMNRTITAGLFTVGTLFIAIFYGMRWFSKSGLRTNVALSSTAWPPLINPCPDYYQKRVNSDGSIDCIDSKNYWTLSTVPGSSPFTVTPAAGSTNDTLRVFTVSDSGIPVSRITQIIEANPSLRWEGVYDGNSQSTRTPFATSS